MRRARSKADLRTAIVEIEGRSSSATQNLKTENTQLQATIAHTKDERDRFARDLGAMKRETEEAWASERVENALAARAHQRRRGGSGAARFCAGRAKLAD